jgi:hypothetical protein
MEPLAGLEPAHSYYNHSFELLSLVALGFPALSAWVFIRFLNLPQSPLRMLHRLHKDIVAAQQFFEMAQLFSLNISSISTRVARHANIKQQHLMKYLRFAAK